MFFVILAPTSSFLPLATEVGRTAVDLPLIAVVLFVVLTVKRLLNTRQLQSFGLVGALGVPCVFGVLTWATKSRLPQRDRNMDGYRGKVTTQSPAQNNLANALDRDGRNAEAELITGWR